MRRSRVICLYANAYSQIRENMKKILLKLLLLVGVWATSYGGCDFPLIQYGSHYYAHINSKMTWDGAKTYAQAQNGYLAIPNDANENGFFVSQGWKEDWIGIHDPALTTNYCEEYNSGCSVDAGQYTTLKGPMTYQNWEVGEPNNLVMTVDRNLNGTAKVQPLGEHWGLIGLNGKWGDYGNHSNSYQNPYKTSFIIEFDASPACNTNVDNNESVLPKHPFCVADKNGDNTAQKEEINLCTQSTTGNVCNADMTQCLPKYEDALCLYGGELNGTRDMCQKMGAISCPPDYTFDVQKDICSKNVTCQNGAISASAGGCVVQSSNTCLDPYGMLADTCQDVPKCPEGYVYDPAQNKCGKATAFQCPSDYYLMARVDKDSCPRCYDFARHDVYCLTRGDYWVDLYWVYKSNGARSGTAAQKQFTAVPGQSIPNTYIGNPGNGCSFPLYYQQTCSGTQCTQTFTLSGSTCNASDYTASTNTDIPFQYSWTSASCLYGGLLNEATDKCEIPITRNCPSGTTWDGVLGSCLGAIDCGTGTLDAVNSKCVINNTINSNTCPEGYSYAPYPIGKCEAIPACINGTYTQNATSIPKPFNNTTDHMVWDKCYLGDNSCPHGNQYVCQTVPSKGEYNYCSLWTCSDSSQMELFGTTEGASDKKNNAVVDENGCTGKIYIFNGKDYRCRSDDTFGGLAGGGCCDKDKVFLGLVSCNQTEKDLAVQNKKKLCHYIGNYCSKKINFGFTKVCVQHKDTYCCFNSVLARIIQEQGRPQLKIEWGGAESPNCRGLKPEEFEKIDFSRIDFSEFEQSIMPNVSSTRTLELQNSTANKIKSYANTN